MKIEKSWVASILFGVAMGISFSMMLGTVGMVLMVPFIFLGKMIFHGLDDPKK